MNVITQTNVMQFLFLLYLHIAVLWQIYCNINHDIYYTPSNTIKVEMVDISNGLSLRHHLPVSDEQPDI